MKYIRLTTEGRGGTKKDIFLDTGKIVMIESLKSGRARICTTVPELIIYADESAEDIISLISAAETEAE